MTGSNAIIAIVVGAIVVIVGFSLWPVLNASSNQLYSYFRDSCDDGSGNRFLRGYVEHTGANPASITRTALSGGNWGLYEGYGRLPSNTDGAFKYDGDASGTAKFPQYRQNPQNQRAVTTYQTFAEVVLYIHNWGLSFGSSQVNQHTAFLGEISDAAALAEVISRGGGIRYAYWTPNGATGVLYKVSSYTPARTATPGNTAYSIQHGHGGAGIRLAASGRDCSFTGEHLNAGDVLFNEYGNHIFTATAAVDASTVQALPYEWIEVADILKRFSGINNLLLTILPVISIAGFLGISGAKLYSYGKGASNIGSALSTSIFTLMAIVIAMVVAGPVIGSLVEANLVVESGQYQINSVFGNIITLLFAMVPIIYVAGLVTLVGLQAKSALMGGRDLLP